MSTPPDNIDYARTSNVTRMHAAAAREKGDPAAQSTPLSLGIIAGMIGIAMLAGNYFGGNTGNDFGAANIKGYEYPRNFDGVVNAGGGGMTPLELHQPANWIASGKAVYGTNCGSCHGPEGTGVAGQYPHLKGSEFVLGGEMRLTSILLHGITGALTVDGKAFNGQMQPLGTTALNNTQLAQVLSYVRNSWGNTASVIYEDQIKEARKILGDRASYTGDEIHAQDNTKPLPKSEWTAKLAAGAATPAAPGTKPAAGAPATAPGPATTK